MPEWDKYRCVYDPDEYLFDRSYNRVDFHSMVALGYLPPGSIWFRKSKYYVIVGAEYHPQQADKVELRRALAKMPELARRRFKILEKCREAFV